MKCGVGNTVAAAVCANGVPIITAVTTCGMIATTAAACCTGDAIMATAG